MTSSSESYHEPLSDLSTETRHMHQALVSLQEELEAVDWYRQRADACQDPELRDILLHNMREEIEHACMMLEWLRRRNPDFADQMDTYLFTRAPITEVEEAQEKGEDQAVKQEGGQPAEDELRRFTIGDLKKRSR
jgi:ferritin-like protein